MKIKPIIFKSYDIRGIYPLDLNEEIAQAVARTYLKLLALKLKKEEADLHLALGRDIRLSSEPLFKAVSEVILTAGATVDDLGLISVNDLYFAVGYYQLDGGIMVTASHNPPEYGGFKMVLFNQKQKGLEVVSGKEILANLEAAQDLPSGKLSGKNNQLDMTADYLQNILSYIDIGKIKPLKVVVDTGNGMAGLMIPKLFAELPCQLIHIFSELDGNFPNRNPNPLADNASQKVAQKIIKEQADLGVMFDSDADRMFLIDEQGRLITGDLTLILLAKSILEKNPGSGVVYNLICSKAVPDLITRWGGRAIRSEVGYVNLSRHMREEGGVISGEVSGHFALANNYYSDSGFIALMLALQTISEDGRSLSQIIKDYTLYARGDEINLKVDDLAAKLDKIRAHYKNNIKDELDGITVEFPDYWFNVRASNTEPLLRITVEAGNQEELRRRQEEVMRVIGN